VHGKPLTVAYISRDDPRTLTERVPVLQHLRHLGDDIIAGDPAAVAATVLADLGVGTVVLDRYKMPGGLERTYTEELAGRIFGGQAPAYTDERITVYRLPAPGAGPDAGPEANAAAATPYLRLGPQNWGLRQVHENGAPHRALTGGPAAVEVLHAAAPVQVTIRYRTDAGGKAEIYALDGVTPLGSLPPAPDGSEVTVTITPVAGGAGLLLQPHAAGTVFVEQLRLE
jgi:hypothetical protein